MPEAGFKVKEEFVVIGISFIIIITICYCQIVDKQEANMKNVEYENKESKYNRIKESTVDEV